MVFYTPCALIQNHKKKIEDAKKSNIAYYQQAEPKIENYEAMEHKFPTAVNCAAHSVYGVDM